MTENQIALEERNLGFITGDRLQAMDHIEDVHQAINSGKKDWVIDFMEENPSIDLENDVWDKRSIYRVSFHIRSLRSEAYEPQLFSLGPYLHGKSHLLPMETHKVRAVTHILKTSERSLTDYVRALEEDVESLMEAYDQLDNKWRNKDTFIRLMIHDGCFLLEIIRKLIEHDYGKYASKDPVFNAESLVGNISVIVSDICRIENQIPMSVLVRLVSNEIGISLDESAKHIHDLAMVFFSLSRPVFPVDERNTGLAYGNHLHMLDLYRNIVIGDEPLPDVEAADTPLISAERLRKQAGVKFKRSELQSLTSTKFENAILYLPQMDIFNCAKAMLLNLMAFEQLHCGAIPILSSYILFTCGLIRNANDVSSLREADLIDTCLTDNEAVAKFMIEVDGDMGFEPTFVLEHVNLELNRYYERRTRKWQKKTREWFSSLKEKYFKSPWTVLSLVAAFVLLGIAVTQTIYAILSYKKSS